LATVDPLTLQVVDSAGCPSIDVGGKLGAISVGDLDLLRRLDEILDTSASGPGGEVCTIDVSDDGRLLASSRATGTAGSDVPQYVTSIVALPSGDPIGQVSGRDPLFSPSSGLLVTSGFGEVAVWDPLTSTEVAVVERFSGSARRAEFTADGEWLITTGRQGLRLWDGATFEPGPNFDPGLFSNQVFSAALDPSGAMIAGATFAGVGVWDGATGELLFENDVGQRGEPHDCGGTMCHGGEVFEVRWSPDGSMLLTGGTDDAVRVIDATTGAELGTIGACSVDGSGYRVAAWINADTIVVVDVGNACSELVRFAGAT
jgi:WD40 repeat protein